MRTKFSSELAALTDDLIQLAGLAHDAAERAAVAVAAADLTAAYEVFAIDEQIQARYGACENRAVLLLALEAPVARDLRHVVSAIQIADDLFHIGRSLAQIADPVVRHYPDPVAPPDIVELLAPICRATIHLTGAAHRAIAAGQPEGESEPAVPDPVLHDAAARAVAVVSAPEWPHGSATAVDIALLAQHYERCAEHCVRIGRLIRFFHTGTPLSAQPAPDSADPAACDP